MDFGRGMGEYSWVWTVVGVLSMVIGVGWYYRHHIIYFLRQKGIIRPGPAHPRNPNNANVGQQGVILPMQTQPPVSAVGPPGTVDAFGRPMDLPPPPSYETATR